MIYGNIKPKFKKNAGQVLVIVTILAIPLVMMAGLAIDGGRLMLEKRHTQNAADAATWAATWKYCTSLNPNAAISMGEELALANGYSDGANQAVEITPSYYETTDTGAPNSSWPQTPNYSTKSIIDSTIEKYMSAVIPFLGPLAVTSVAGSNCRGVNPLAENKVAIYAFSETCQDPVNIAEKYVWVKGGIISRGDVKITGNTNIVDGIIEYGRYYQSDAVLTPSTGNPIYDPNNQIPTLFTFDQFKPGGYYAELAIAESPNLYHYYGTGNKMFNTNGPEKNAILEGLYVINDGDLTILGNNYTIGPKGATFVSRKGFSVSANDVTDLKPYIAGLLIFASQTSTCGSNAISISTSTVGTDDISIEGIIYAPNGGCRIDAADTYATVAVFCNTVDLHGSNLELTYYQLIEGLMPPSAIWYTE